jgi:hypothetical protein
VPIFVAFQTTTKTELFFPDDYMRDYVPNYFEGSSLHLSWEVLLTESVLVIFPNFIIIQIKYFHLREAAVHQAVGIPEVVALYIIHSLPMKSVCRQGHAAFCITPTEVMLL